MSASESADLSDQGEASDSDESMQEAASGSDEGDEGSDEEESEEEVLEPKVLPARGTRGNRMNALVAEEESGDEEFWQQEFFAEETRDEEYEKSSEGEDEADTDFSESEDEGEEAEEDEKETRRSSSRLKPLKPPGSKKPAAPKPKQPMSAEAKAAQAALKAEKAAQQLTPGAAPTLRHSTRVRVEEAEQVRLRAEKVKPRRFVPKIEHRALTQEEILAEAARTELDNLRDLEQMVAIEEATKQKALYKRSKYSGPMIRYHSKQVDGAALTMVEVVNMLPPPHMLPAKAPKPVAKSRCAITGKPAVYRDPVSGHAYADLAAYKELKQRWESDRRGKTGKRTKRQRTSSIPQSTVPLASLSEQVSQAVEGSSSEHLQAMQHLAPAAVTGALPTLQPQSATGPGNEGVINAAPTVSIQMVQRHVADEPGPLQTLPTASDVPVLPSPIPLGSSQSAADTQPPPSIVPLGTLHALSEVVNQGQQAEPAPPASAEEQQPHQ